MTFECSSKHPFTAAFLVTRACHIFLLTSPVFDRISNISNYLLCHRLYRLAFIQSSCFGMWHPRLSFSTNHIIIILSLRKPDKSHNAFLFALFSSSLNFKQNILAAICVKHQFLEALLNETVMFYRFFKQLKNLLCSKTVIVLLSHPDYICEQPNFKNSYLSTPSRRQYPLYVLLAFFSTSSSQFMVTYVCSCSCVHAGHTNTPTITICRHVSNIAHFWLFTTSIGRYLPTTDSKVVLQRKVFNSLSDSFSS